MMVVCNRTHTRGELASSVRLFLVVNVGATSDARNHLDVYELYIQLELSELGPFGEQLSTAGAYDPGVGLVTKIARSSFPSNLLKGRGEVSKKMDSVVVNTQAVAKMFGVTDRRVRQFVEEGVIDRVGHGRFNVIDTVNKYVTHLRMSNDQLDENDITESLEYERYLHEKAKREKAEIELAHIKGTMHSANEVEKVMNNMLASFRARMLSLPSKVTPSLANQEVADIEKIIESQVHEALIELSNYDPSAFIELEEEVDEDGPQN